MDDHFFSKNRGVALLVLSTDEMPNSGGASVGSAKHGFEGPGGEVEPTGPALMDL